MLRSPWKAPFLWAVVLRILKLLLLPSCVPQAHAEGRDTFTIYSYSYFSKDSKTETARHMLEKGGGETVVESLVDRTVSLPCLAAQRPHHDTPSLLLYYQGDSNFPFFSYDAREGQFWKGGSSRTRDPLYEGRVALNISAPQRVALNLHRVTRNDTGRFTCRVDFHGSPSLNSGIILKVYENPRYGPNITLWQNGVGRPTEDKIQGPFHEGDSINLTCTVEGGYPQPVVTWWQEDALIDNVSHVEAPSAGSALTKVVNLLTLGPLTRQLVRDPFTCRSENNPLSKPRFDTVHLKIYMSPRGVVLDPKLTVAAGERQTVECRAIGSYPEANITWTLNNKTLKAANMQKIEQDGEDTISRVAFVPSPHYNGAPLTCTAASRTLSDPPVTATVNLNVTHAPIVHLQLGSNLSPDSIRQGSDVYFDCQSTANPPVQRITWYKEGQAVWQRSDAGVLINGNNLVLQRVQRAHGGNYSCRAANAVGITESNSVALSVMYGPVCTQERQTVTAVEGETVELECNVDANPSNVTFHWLFNNTVDSTRFRENEYTVEDTRSTLRHVAYSARDYGTVFCWASNMVASQLDPCAFTLQPAGAPDSVEDCVLTNQSAGSLHITCKPGADGGLTQTFRAEVFLADGTAVRQRESLVPAFTIEGLAPGEDYTVTVTAVNRKGASPPVSLQAYTLKVAENRMISGVSTSRDSDPGASGSSRDVYGGAVQSSKEFDGGMSPLAGAVAGAVGVILAVVMAAVVVARRRCRGIRQRAINFKNDGDPCMDNIGILMTSNRGGGISKKCTGEESNKTSPRTPHSPPHSEITLSGTDLQSSEETDPFLMGGAVPKATIVVATSKGHCGSLVGGGGNGTTAGVFTIPANIPPPPQYCSSPCSELSPTQHTLHHTVPTSAARSVHGMAKDMRHTKQLSPHPHVHINPHHQHTLPSHQLQRQPCQSIKPACGGQQPYPCHGSSEFAVTAQNNNSRGLNLSHPQRCYSPSCVSSPLQAAAEGGPHCGSALMRTLSTGSPQCSVPRILTPTHHHVLQTQERATPPPALTGLQRQQIGGAHGSSTPPLVSGVHSPATTPHQYPQVMTCAGSSSTLPRQRSYEIPAQRSGTLQRQRSINTDHNAQLTHLQLMHVNTAQQGGPPPSELSYVQPNSELPTVISSGGVSILGPGPSGGSASQSGGGNNVVSSGVVGKVLWEGASSGVGSDV